MPRYDFGSPGAAGLDALTQFLVQRALEEREQKRLALTEQGQQADIRQRDDDLRLRREQEQRMLAEHKSTQEALNTEREFRRATTLTDNSMPGDPIDADTEAMLTRQGYGGAMTKAATPGIVAPAEFMQENMVPGIMDVLPEQQRTVARGGSKFLTQQELAKQRAEAAKTAADQRADIARMAEEGRNERAASDRDTRTMIAGMANQGRAETTGLRNDLLQTQVDAAKNKAEDKKLADKRARDAARVTSGATIDVLKQLADFDEQGNATLKPGAANLFGARMPGAGLIPGSDTANAQSALDRLRGRVIIDLLNEMKNQSRTGATGFGSLSAPELTKLEQASSQLNSSLISDRRVAEELSRIYQSAKRLYGDDSATETAPGGAGQAEYDWVPGRGLVKRGQ